MFSSVRCVRFVSVRRMTAFGHAEAIAYERHGDPRTVLRRVEAPPKTPLAEDELLIRMLAAPVNPADINTIQGTYGRLPELPAVGGNEGVGQVISAGPSPRHSLVSGDWVVPSPRATWGTWRTHVVAKAGEVLQVPSDIPLLSAATLKVNPATAYRMLHDFKQLHAGDVIMQNAANSGVGQAVIQVANHLGLTSINVLRDREDLAPVSDMLRELGATYVITDHFLASREMAEFVREHGKPKLILNGVGGKMATEMMRHMEPGATMVTYGGMSREPLTIPTSALIFKNLRFFGFWMSQWYKERAEGREGEIEEMFGQLVKMVRKGKLKAPHCNLLPLTRYDEAVQLAMQPKTTTKQIIFMEQYDSD